MAYYGSETYDHERPRNRHSRHSQYLLDPNSRLGGGLHRTRSHGHSPAPQINIYNDQLQDNYQRAESPYRYPQVSPPQVIPPQVIPPQVIPVPYPVDYRHHSPSSNGSSRGRRHSRLGEDLISEMGDMALAERLRSRSRGRSDADYYLYKQREREESEKAQRDRWEREAELKRIKDAADKKEHDERVLAEYKAKMDKDEKEKTAERERILAEAEEEKRKKEAKEKKAYEDFLILQKKKEEDKKQKEKEEKEKIDQEMKRRLINAGYSDAQIEFIIDEERQKKLKERAQNRPSDALVTVGSDRAPVYVKIHKDHLSVDTLIYYEIPYEWDRVSKTYSNARHKSYLIQRDPNYLIVKREMDKYETEVLFEHTRRLRSGKLLVEGSNETKGYVWRKRDRSTSRVRQAGIVIYKDKK